MAFKTHLHWTLEQLTLFDDMYERQTLAFSPTFCIQRYIDPRGLLHLRNVYDGIKTHVYWQLHILTTYYIRPGEIAMAYIIHGDLTLHQRNMFDNR